MRLGSYSLLFHSCNYAYLYFIAKESTVQQKIVQSTVWCSVSYSTVNEGNDIWTADFDTQSFYSDTDAYAKASGVTRSWYMV